MKIYVFILIIAFSCSEDSVSLTDLKIIGTDFDDTGDFIGETAESKVTGKKYKILSFYNQNDSQIAKLSKQIDIFRLLSIKNPKNVLKVYSLVKNKSKSLFPFLNVILGKNPTYQLVTEYYLYNYREFLPRRMKHSKSVSMMVLNLLKAIKSLHIAGFAYFNLNPATIVASEESQVKFFDFREAEKIHEKSFFKGIKGNFNYASPEMLSGQEYTEKADIWAFGLVALEMFSLSQFSFADKRSVLDFLMLGNGIKEYSKMKWIIPSGQKTEFWRKIIFERCLVSEDSRATAAEILEEYYEMTSEYFEDTVDAV